jgi:hypothetical protein
MIHGSYNIKDVFVFHTIHSRTTRCHPRFYLNTTCFYGNCSRTTKHTKLMNIHLLFFHRVVSRQVYSLFQSECSTHTVRSSASPFNLQYPLVFLRSSNRCLRLHFRISTTFILPSIFPSMTYFRSQFLRKTWTIQLAYLLFIVCRIFPQQKLIPMWVFTNI